MRTVWYPIAALLLGGPPAAAAAPELALPLACTPGADCWPVRYVDHDPGPGVRDYACGAETGDGHDGTDIAIRDLAAMAAGVEVLAPAPGTVVGTRDGEPDRSVLERGDDAISGRECGNGVRIDHGGGWATQVCHLRRGSVRVLEGDRVETGDPLGLVGLSGDTSFPHLHLGVQKDGAAVDPFLGAEGGAACAPGSRPLWRPDLLDALRYRPVILHAAGFATAPPEVLDLRRGWHREAELPVTSPALVFWIDGFWFERGDRLTFEIAGPEGAPPFEDSRVLDDDHRRYFAFAGRRRPEGGWPPGTYRGTLTLERDAEGGPPIRDSVTREVVLR